MAIAESMGVRTKSTSLIDALLLWLQNGERTQKNHYTWYIESDHWCLHGCFYMDASLSFVKRQLRMAIMVNRRTMLSCNTSHRVHRLFNRFFYCGHLSTIFYGTQTRLTFYASYQLNPLAGMLSTHGFIILLSRGFIIRRYLTCY